MKKAVVLISGGVDSTTVAYQAKRDGYELFGVSFLYGQKAQEEIECAKRTMKKLGGKHLVLDLNILEKIFKSPLINDDIRPELNKIGEKGDSYYIVPLRNMVFLSIACAYAESIGAERVYIGSHKGDFNGFPDCRAEFISALQNAIDKGTAKEQTIVPVITAPWQFIDKSEIIEIGKEMGVDYNDTYSCYQSGGPCGVCESCILRAEAFRKAGL